MCNSLHIMNHYYIYITGQTVKLTGGLLHAKISLVSAHKACLSSTNRLPLRVPSGFHRSEPLVQGVTTFSRQYFNGLFLLHVKHTRLTGLHGSNPGICLSTFFCWKKSITPGNGGQLDCTCRAPCQQDCPGPH